MNVHYATNIRLRAWIHVALRPIRFPLTRRTLRREFSDHFEDCRDAMLDRGLSERDADEKALESLGNASQTAKLLRLVYRPRIYAVRAGLRVRRDGHGDSLCREGLEAGLPGTRRQAQARGDLGRVGGSGGALSAAAAQSSRSLGLRNAGTLLGLESGVLEYGFGEWVPSPDLFEKSCLFLRGNLDLSYDCQRCMITCGYGDCRWYILAADSPYADEAQLRSLFIQPLKSYQEYVEYWRTPWDER